MASSPVASPKTRSRITPDLSSPLSFRAALATPSSQILLELNSDATRDSETAQYRPTKFLPYELRHHCLVYLEEQLYSSALSLLNNLLTSGTSYPTPADPAFVPPPSHIALTSTLLVHPIHTTRASSRERIEVSSDSLILLRNILNILGPVNAKLKEAFTFTSPRRGSPRRRLDRKSGSRDRRSPTDSDEPISSALADESSLWTRAQDFWHVVGWAFNCSVNHRKRWEYWKVWLEYMLDVLEADWKERLRLDEEYNDSQDANADATPNMLQNCLLVRYMSEAGKSSSSIRRVVKAVFADGSVGAIRAYPEVFEKETRERNQKAGMKRKRELKVDLEEDKYGDYTGNEDDEEGEDLIQFIQSSPTAADEESDRIRNLEAPGPAIAMGGPEAIILRLRLLALLSLACSTFPDSFTTVASIYDVFYEVICPLPLAVFSSFMSTAAYPYVPAAALSSLAQVHLIRLLPNSVPVPPTDELSQENLERCFLPFAANTTSIEDNAKVSLLIETLFRLFATSCDIDPTPELAAAAEKGIAAREAKCTSDRRKKPGGSKNEGDMIRLKASADRIRFLLKFIQVRKTKIKSPV